MKDLSNPKLDRTDRRLLKELQTNGRMTNAELANRTNTSPATCHRRTQRLFEDGLIRSVRAQIDAGAVERSALVMVGVVLDRSTHESFGAFEAAIVKLPFVLDCHLVAGDFDY
ncbi:Lrp/AsnC family transcriptional regulator, partial [Rhizobiaceae bacterium]|nr:Lrp/AsnC family transcriptional regulator [Rhizobiaceae bacterium]